ncbi:potassium transport protein 1 [Ampelomyces quisqualis]|uniref:Potassium transport protein 1 n=1 Tax=Ampelomyces quisqualis TaxID=50730 RepID=A0A6A5QM99_AMPQU|nr:potassium transport protein 1 [Ampelomyces quisqualis]
MWRPPINFITLHYAYILSFGILALIILYPRGNLSAIDAYFFGVSASTESGLNPVDVKDLKLYQQVFLYITPIVTNLGFINVIVVVVRLRWFRQRFKGLVTGKASTVGRDSRRQNQSASYALNARDLEEGPTLSTGRQNDTLELKPVNLTERSKLDTPRITFAPAPQRDNAEKHALYIPGPRDCERGQPVHSLSDDEDEDEDRIESAPTATGLNEAMRRRRSDTRSLSKATSMENAVSSIFVLGSNASRTSQDKFRPSKSVDLASLSPDELGGIEYRALRVLLKITIGYFVGLHLFGVICLVPWIHLASTKYKDYLDSVGENKTWWAIYSAQTMVDNLGLTLTPDSMVSFRDATWPMLLMSFLAFAGNTLYPCFLRLLIWTMYKLAPSTSSLKESLRFLLDHPRRCYTLLFPATATWILAAIVVALNFLDTLLIVLLDLDNPEVNVLPIGSRIVAAIFQAASARHTGTASFNLANVNPAVQFSLLVMMYISIYPIAISIRMSSDYEEQSVGLYGVEESLDEKRGGRTYLINHMRNQLSFDLWYIFLGVFCICCSESKRIMSREDYAFSVFSIFFEVVSAYGNVGLSLGHPSNLTSLSGHFTVFSKVVICAMMIRGRHRGLPYALDRAITLPIDHAHDTKTDEA